MSVVFSMAYKAWKDSWTSPHTLAWADTSWTMVRARTLLLVVTCCCCAWLRLAGADDSSLETRSSDFPMKTQQEKELVRHFRNDVILCYGSFFFIFRTCCVFVLFILPDWRVARSFGEAEKQRDAVGEKAWMAAIGLYKFLSCLKRDS